MGTEICTLIRTNRLVGEGFDKNGRTAVIPAKDELKGAGKAVISDKKV